MSDSPAPLVSTRALSVVRGGRTLIDAVDMAVHAGEIVTLIGPNGAGKTTLVRTVLGLMRSTRGEVQRRPRLRIGYMPQKLHIDPSLPLDVLRFLTLGEAQQPQAQQALERTGAGHLLHQPLINLSGGETQRVLLARALLKRPELLVLDEPVQGVDVTGQAALYALISELRDELGCGVLLVSHDLHLVMANTDTVICLNQHVCCHGHPAQVSLNPAFLKLFGHRAEAQVALYTHHHDHQHEDQAELINPVDREHPHA